MKRLSLGESVTQADPSSGSGADSLRHIPTPALLRVQISYRFSNDRHRSALGVGSSFNVTGQTETRDTRSQIHLQAGFSLSTLRNVLFGASGAGKSTLLRLLSGLLQPIAGSIVLGDRTLTDTSSGIALPPGRRGIGYLTQEAALFPHLSVEDNIAFGLHGLQHDLRIARVSAMLDLFSLQPLAKRMPLRLSGGERQRVALARALAPGPSLLLLDEPFAGLDAPLRNATIAALDDYLKIRETPVLAISHDVAEVYASGAEVLLLEGGRIAAQGSSHVVLSSQREKLLRQLGVPPRDLT